MAIYTITLLELASTLSSGTLENRKNVLESWIFNREVGLENDLYEKFKKIFISQHLYEEIGYETPALFRDRLLSDLYEKADYYNQLWRLFKILKEWDFMEDDIDIKTEENEKSTITGAEEVNRSQDTDDAYTQSKNIIQSEHNTQQNNSEQNNESERNGEENINFNEEQNNKGEITDINHEEKSDQGEKNKGLSDFPQSMLIANKDYWTKGDKEISQVYGTLDNTNTRKLADGYDKENLSHNNKMETNTANGRVLDNGESDRDLEEENNEQSSRRIQEKLEDIVEKIISSNKGNDSARKGRVQRRQVPEIINMIANQYIYVPTQISNDMSSHFMSIW